MSKLKAGLLLIVIFIVSLYWSFYFEESYRKIIRYLYVAFTNGKISFFIPKKALHFASGEFVFSFGLFAAILSFLLYRQTSKQRTSNVALGLFLLLASILIQSYFGSSFKLIECTACNDGNRKLYYKDINYDIIFISSLVLAIVPAAATEIKRLIRLKKQKN